MLRKTLEMSAASECNKAGVLGRELRERAGRGGRGGRVMHPQA